MNKKCVLCLQLGFQLIFAANVAVSAAWSDDKITKTITSKKALKCKPQMWG